MKFLIRSAAVSCGAARVQGLEDLLGVLVGPEVDDDHLEQLSNRSVDRVGTCLKDILVSLQPFPGASRKVLMSLCEPTPSKLDTGVDERSISGHDGVERDTISVGWPDLETIFRLRRVIPRVHGQVFEPACALLGPSVLKLPAQRIEKQLQGRQTLLSVDDRPFLHGARRILALLKDHGAEEMRLMRCVRLPQQALRHPCDVAPQGLPLIILVPDVWTLEQRDLEPLWLHEHSLRGADLSLHLDGLRDAAACFNRKSTRKDRSAHFKVSA